MLKKIGLVLLAVVFALLVFPSILPHEASMERRVLIRSTPATIYAVLIDFNQFRSWDPWSPMEPESTSQVEGLGVGSRYSWSGEKVGRGSMLIQSVKENEQVDVLLTFEDPFPAEALTGWRLADTGNGETEVTWHYKQEMPYFQRYFGLMFDAMLGKDFESGLARLKTRIEGQTS
ncbi:SRPBCC family protein [Oligoflexus tunisiensis]|uniref:SRPBCC family protein n=1 Tax=Oligoflexus tunisiensis TaxID=708132 RepID=UPI00159F22F6|nr:SRPBCC family protein [Oligoflexus tunisiensis]